MSRARAEKKIKIVDLADRKAEILRLIKRVSSEDDQLSAGGLEQAPIRGHLEPPPQNLPQHRPPGGGQKQLHQELTRIRQQRRQLEDGLVEDLVHSLYRKLEGRVATLEQTVAAQASGGNGQPSPAAQDCEPRPIEFILGGKIQEGLMADILQLISSNILTGVFRVDHQQTTLRLYFKDGEICHADGDGMSGENAVFAALALEEGQFAFDETDDLPEQRTIENKTQFLILEALRQIDEERAQGNKS